MSDFKIKRISAEKVNFVIESPVYGTVVYMKKFYVSKNGERKIFNALLIKSPKFEHTYENGELRAKKIGGERSGWLLMSGSYYLTADELLDVEKATCKNIYNAYCKRMSDGAM